MTPKQRDAVRLHNARKSTGPRTAEGKARARRNSLKHGLCAQEIALIIEDSEALQNEFDEWFAQYEPVGPAEAALVKDIALCQLKLNRCRGREAAVVGLQVHKAYSVWCDEQDDKLAALRQRLATGPAAAARELARFGAGRDWLIGRWTSFAQWLERDGYCNTPALIDEGVRLLGGDPQDFQNGPLPAYLFRVLCTGASPTPDPRYTRWLLCASVIHPDYQAQYGTSLPDTASCRAELRAFVARQLATLEEAGADLAEEEGAALKGVCRRAQVPVAGEDTKQALRYESMNRAALHKALKELSRLQKERFAAELALPPAQVRNEADIPPEPPLTIEPVATYNASENTNPAPPTPAGPPATSWRYPLVADLRLPTCASYLSEQPEMPVVLPGAASLSPS